MDRHLSRAGAARDFPDALGGDLLVGHCAGDSVGEEFEGVEGGDGVGWVEERRGQLA